MGVKYRLWPSREQEKHLFACIAVRRKSWNKLHELVTSSMSSEEPPKLSDAIKAAMKAVRRMKYEPGNEWMSEYSSSISDYVSLRYNSAWDAFYRKVKNGEVSQKRAEYISRRKAAGKPVNPAHLESICKPSFQARSDEDSFQVKGRNCRFSIKMKAGLLEFKGSAGPLRFNAHRFVPFTHISTVTISHTNIGEWYVSFSVETCLEIPEPVAPSRILALDSNIVGYQDSEGTLHEHPRPYAAKQELESRLKRQLLRKQKGNRDTPPSKRYLKAKKRLNKLQKKIQRRRTDWQHKLSAELAGNSAIDAVAIENLSIQEMMKKPLPIPGKTANDFLPNGATDQSRINRAMSDISHARFREMLEYKMKWNGKTVITVDTILSTNKTCSACGHVEKSLSFRKKKWICSACGAIHEKYANSAAVILGKARNES